MNQLIHIAEYRNAIQQNTPTLEIKKRSPSYDPSIFTSVAHRKNALDRLGADLEILADEISELVQKQIDSTLYSYERYLELGSDSQGIVCDSAGHTQKCVVWCMDHYTGLNQHPDVIRTAQAAIELYGTGSGASAVSGGLCHLHKQIETMVTRVCKKPAAMLFPSGFAANLGALSSLPRKEDLVLFDGECHASIIDGMRASDAKWLPFRHNDIPDLEKKLAAYGSQYRDIFVVVESVYSISGDIAPLKEIVDLKHENKFYLYVDEAHSFGFYGPQGGGLCAELGISDGVDFIVSTLSKATASIGGFIACEAKYLLLLKWCANPYKFQTALPPGDAGAIKKALELLATDNSFAEKIHANNRYMRNRIADIRLDVGNSRSPIIPVFIPDVEKLIAVNQTLYKNGVFSMSVVYPAVKPNAGRIKYIVTARHSKDEIDYTVEQLDYAFNKHAIFRQSA